MDYATTNLENDHVSILKLIDVVSIMTTKTPPVEDLEEVVELIRKFADGLHHAKEENLLFPLMAQRGFSMYQGPIAVMLHDHVEGRNYVKGAADHITLYKAGDNTALYTVFENLTGYSELLQNHIAKENNILFRMADKTLSLNDHEELIAKFAEVENKANADQSKEQYIARIDALANKYTR